MRKPVSLETRRELSSAIAELYRAADRPGKKAILNEFVKVTGYHRKHAIRIMNGNQVAEKQKPVGERIHRLQQVRAQAFGARRKKNALNRVRKLVAVKTFADWEGTRPGFMEMDLVTHCGTRAVGSFVHTFVLTDVASGWTECVALPAREQSLIVEAVTAVEARLPFPLLGLDTDNDSAFMNDTLWDYCQKKGLKLTRSRAYRKNDQAWVEQKNGAVVRMLIGYGRLEGLAATAALRRLYEASRLYVNFFQPSFKLKSKEREGAKVHKRYESPETPFRRLLQRDDIPENTKQRLEEQFQQLDPVLLLKHIRDAQAAVVALSQNITPPPLSEDMQKFVSSLATAWSSGEVRPTHRREPQSGRWWRMRRDPFADVWPVLLGWLEERPDMEAKEMVKRLQASGYGSYTDGQLRTLQRRVREWRTRIAHDLVYGRDVTQVGTAAEAIETDPPSRGETGGVINSLTSGDQSS